MEKEICEKCGCPLIKTLIEKQGDWYICRQCHECFDEFLEKTTVNYVIENLTTKRNQISRRIAQLKKATLKQ